MNERERANSATCEMRGRGWSRRKFLQAAAIAGAGAAVAPRLLGQGNGGKPFRIDVHHHVLSPEYLKRSGRGSSNPRLGGWTPAKSIAEMDKAAIATSMLSIAVGEVRFQADEATRVLVRDSNDFAAKMVRDYPGRFAVLASLPLPDPDASLKEIEYAYGTLKAAGIALLTDYGDKWLGDPSFVPVFEELNRRKAVVFVHPTAPNCCTELVPKIPEAWEEYDFDTERTFASMLVNGTLEKYPDVRYIFTHSGGTLPAMAGRLDHLLPAKAAGERAPQGVMSEVGKLYFDIAAGTYPAALAALLTVVPTSHVCFGTDYPFVDAEHTLEGFEQHNFSASDRAAIDRENALRLFPGVKA